MRLAFISAKLLFFLINEKRENMIDEERLKLWSQPPSQTEMKKIQRTHEVIREILGDCLPIDRIKSENNLGSFNLDIYLQGSYANSTNIRWDSDVDLVIQLNSVFFVDKSQLNPLEEIFFDTLSVNSNYPFLHFKNDVYDCLRKKFGTDVSFAPKCIKLQGGDSRINADIVPCFQFKLYKSFISKDHESFTEGMKFFDTRVGDEKINFPKIHKTNCEVMNIVSKGNFKGLVRIFKHLRNELVENNKISTDLAPSYFIENLIYNCFPIFCTQDPWQNLAINILEYLIESFSTNRAAGFICANLQQSLFGPKCWNQFNATRFLIEATRYLI